MIIDFHTHTFLSDGALSPAEHIRRAIVAQYKAIGITDHVDFSNLETVFNQIKKMTDEVKTSNWDIIAIPGVEFTHVPVDKIEKLTLSARALGVPLIIVHGESIAEPVEPGTNKAAILAGVDILAHPGLISEDDVKLAVQKNVYLEITAKKGHSLTNGHVFKLAKKHGAKLVLDSDAHIHSDFLTESHRRNVLFGCGMGETDIADLNVNMESLLSLLCKQDN